MDIQASLARVDAFQQGRRWLAFPFAVLKKFSDDRAGGLAATIAYYGFFSVFPLLLVLVSASALLLHGNPELQRRVLSSALDRFPVIGQDIGANVHALSGSWLALFVGMATALWAGLGAIDATQAAMDAVWDHPRSRGPSFVRRKARGVFLLVSLGSAVLLGGLLAGLSTAVGGGWGSALALTSATAINVATLLVTFRLLSTAEVSWRDVLPGAAAGGVVWTALQALGGVLVARQVQGASATYGAFAIVIGLLWWIYLSAQITLFAAELNVVHRDRLWPRTFFGAPEREEDRRALARQAEEQAMHPTERVEVTFGREGSAGRSTPTPP